MKIDNVMENLVINSRKNRYWWWHTKVSLLSVESQFSVILKKKKKKKKGNVHKCICLLTALENPKDKFVLHCFHISQRILFTGYLLIESKVGNLTRGWPEGSLFDSYYTKV